MWTGSKTVAFLCPGSALLIPFGSSWCPGQGTSHFSFTFCVNWSHSVWTSAGSGVCGLLHTQYSGFEHWRQSVHMHGRKAFKIVSEKKNDWCLTPSCPWRFILNWMTVKSRHCKADYPLASSPEKNHFEQNQLKIVLSDGYVQQITMTIHGITFMDLIFIY